MSKTIESSDNLPHPPPLTPEQRKLITATVPILAEHGITITTLFYEQLLESNPDLRNVFSHSNQEVCPLHFSQARANAHLRSSLQRGLQAKALARTVYAYAANIEDLTPILPVVERIAHKHASIHVAPAHYAVVGKHLEAITQVVGADVFKGDLYEAWGAAYWNLAHVFINRERELYEAAQWVGWREFFVAKKIRETEEVTSFHLKPKDGKPLEPYRPGQYISVQKFVPELGLRQSRQQVILSAQPNEVLTSPRVGTRCRTRRTRTPSASLSSVSPVFAPSHRLARSTPHRPPIPAICRTSFTRRSPRETRLKSRSRSASSSSMIRQRPSSSFRGRRPHPAPRHAEHAREG